MTKNNRHRFGIKTISLLVGALMPCVGAAAQSSGSPYSMFGLGNFNAKGDVRSYGMGGAGMALASENSLGNLNVASLTGLDSMLFFIDLQAKANYTQYSTSQMSESNTDSNFENISFGFKVAPYWGLTFGISSLSNTDYNIRYSNYILGTLSTYDILFQGKGGLSKIYWGNGWRLAKGLSVGLNLSYVWGSLSTYKTSTFSTINGESIENQTTYYLKNLVWDAGIQYQHQWNNNSVSIGVTYQPKTSLLANYKQSIVGNSTYFTDEGDVENYELPETIGGGIGFNINKSITFAADYTLERWSNASNPIRYAGTNDAYSIKTGIEYAPQKNVYNSIFNRMHYRVGANMGDTYLKVNGTTISYKSISAGLGIPLRQKRNYINIGYQYTDVGTESAGLIKEASHTIKLGLSLSENWFFKSKFD